MTDYILELDRVTKDFSSFLPLKELFKLNFTHKKPIRALENITFSLNKNKVLGILGPNGAGKTTLIKIISTLILPDQGSVKVKGFSLGIDDEKIKSTIGLLTSSERGLYPRLTGRQNLEFFATLYGLSKKQTKARIEELFALFQVNYQDRRFDSYSSGMQQKFALIRALLHNPDLLLLDEPTKSLDYTTALNFRNFIKEELVRKQGKTILFTTHRMDEAMDFADLFLILHNARLFAFGTLQELQKKVKNSAATLGEIFLTLTQRS